MSHDAGPKRNIIIIFLISITLYNKNNNIYNTNNNIFILILLLVIKVLGANARPKRIGSWYRTQVSWVLTQDRLGLGPNTGPKRIGFGPRVFGSPNLFGPVLQPNPKLVWVLPPTGPNSNGHSFETWPSPAGWPGRPRAGTGSGCRKNGGRKNPMWLDKTWSKFDYKPVDFYFFLIFFY